MDINYQVVRIGWQILDLLIDRAATVEQTIEEWKDVITDRRLPPIRMVFRLLDHHSSGWTTTDADTAGLVASWILNICVALKPDVLNVLTRMTGVVKYAYGKNEIDNKKYIALRALHQNFRDIIEWLDTSARVWTFVPLSVFRGKTLVIAY